MAITINKVGLANGDTAEIRDANAQTRLEALQNYTASGVQYKGATTTALTDQATTSPITINEVDYEPKNGDMVNYDNVMFAWNGTQWDKLGQAGEYGDLAYANSATMKDFQALIKTQPVKLDGTPTKFNISIKADGSNTITAETPQTDADANYQPAGTISHFDFHGTKDQPVTVKGTTDGTVSIKVGDATDKNYTPEGEIKFKETPNVDVGSVTINSVSNVGKVPSFNATVSDENLKISWASGSPVVTKEETVGSSGVKNITINPSFEGKAVDLHADFQGKSIESTGLFTPEGTNDIPTFEGAKTKLIAAFSSNPVEQEIDYTPEVTLPGQTLTGEKQDITVTRQQ